MTLVTTSLAAAAGGVSAAFFSNLLYKNFDLTMFMNGVLGGLVGITAGADQMSPTDAILIGTIAGIVVVLGIALIDKLKLDDPVGAVAVHLICGIWGTLAVGIFGQLAGLDQFLVQLIGVGIVGAFCVAGSFIILTIVKATTGLRVDKEEIVLTLHNGASERDQTYRRHKDSYIHDKNNEIHGMALRKLSMVIFLNDNLDEVQSLPNA